MGYYVLHMSALPKVAREPGPLSQPIAHELKSWPQFFTAIVQGAKTHELRRATDRTFEVGQLIRLNEFEPALGAYTGRSVVVEITYLTSAELPCALSKGALHDDFCILSIRRVDDA
jgi:hypothetical protein